MVESLNVYKLFQLLNADFKAKTNHSCWDLYRFIPRFQPSAVMQNIISIEEKNVLSKNVDTGSHSQ